MTELKPCPFCGGSVHIVTAIKGIRMHDYYAIVHPLTEECILNEVETDAYADKEELIDLWNRRVSE